MKPEIKKSDIWQNTNYTKFRLEKRIKQLEKLKNDPSKKTRLESFLCIECFYTEKWGGQAFTKRKCGSCERELTFSSTSTDKYCEGCAKKYGVCKHCGADVTLKNRRRFDDSSMLKGKK